jgi:O-antigen/teichoic acid export membrane protein
MAKSNAQPAVEEHRGLSGFLVGLIAAVFMALPFSACIAFATHPASRRLFGEVLSGASTVGFQVFWWLAALLCAAVPFLIGYAVSGASRRTTRIILGVVAVGVVAVVVLSQLFVF